MDEKTEAEDEEEEDTVHSHQDLQATYSPRWQSVSQQLHPQQQQQQQQQLQQQQWQSQQQHAYYPQPAPFQMIDWQQAPNLRLYAPYTMPQFNVPMQLNMGSLYQTPMVRTAVPCNALVPYYQSSAVGFTTEYPHQHPVEQRNNDNEAEYPVSNRSKDDHHESNQPMESLLTSSYDRNEATHRRMEQKSRFADLKPLNRSNMLSESRKKLLQENRRILCKTISLTKTSLLEQLHCLNSIGSDDKEVIQLAEENKEQVGELLDVIDRKTNRDYEHLCDTLDQTNQGGTVKNLLLTEDDVVSARMNLAQYMLTEFTDIQLYTTEEHTNPISHNKIYVNVNWKRYKDGVCTGIQEQLESYFEVFAKMKENNDVRVVITGEPGAGKTTFVKNVCHQWANIVKNKTKLVTSNAAMLLSKYTLVIPIILRLIQRNMTIKDILQHQISSLQTLEVYAIIDTMENEPESVLMLFDGYDEMSNTEPVNSILRKKQDADIEVLVTTRPHGVIFIKTLGSQAMDQLAEICKFTNDQIKEYIDLFFKLQDETARGNELFQYLTERRKKNLLELARLPIRLEMMCLVWSVRKDLGEKLVDLYIKFTEYLLGHKEKKRRLKTPAKKILEKYSQFLSIVGRLAFSWEDNGTMKTIFSHTELQEQFQEHLREIMEFGCITKYHPSVRLEASYWSFTHRSLQEFFVAYYFSQIDSTNAFDKFVQMCSTISRLESQQLVLTFLCGLNPKRANSLLKKIIIAIEEEVDCKRLFSLLLSIVPEYRRPNDIDLPLPQYVDLRNLQESTGMDLPQRGQYEANYFIERMFTTDKNYRHLKKVSTSGSNAQVKLIIPNAAYIKQLSLTTTSVCNFENMAKDIFPHLVMATDISIKVDRLGTNDDDDDDDDDNYDDYYDTRDIDLTCLNPMELQFLNIEGKNIVKPVADVIKNFRAIKKLSLTEKDENVNDAAVTELCTAASQCKTLKFIELEIVRLFQTILKVHSSVKLSLRVKRMINSEFSQFVDCVGASRNVPLFHEFHLENSSVGLIGDKLGHLLSLMPKLHVLNLNHGSITKETIDNMICALSDTNSLLSLRELHCFGSSLVGAGKSVGKLLAYAPHLHTLDIGKCKFKTEDLEEMQKSMPNYTRIRKLRIDIVDAVHLKKYKIWTAVPELEKLYLTCEPFQDNIMNNAKLSKLRILDLRDNKLSTGNLHSIAKFLPSTMETLGLANCNLDNMKECFPAIGNLTRNLRHLDIHGNYFKEDLSEIKSRKQDFLKLNLLNIGNGTDDYKEILDGIREELVQDNPDLQVYYDDNESMW